MAYSRLRSQFSVRQLLALIAAVGYSVCLLSSYPTLLSGIVLLYTIIAIPAVLIVCIIHDEGFFRTFCIGALVPSVLTLFVAGIIVAESTRGQYSPFKAIQIPYQAIAEQVSVKLRFPAVTLFSASILTGLICVATHWLLIRPSAEPKD